MRAAAVLVLVDQAVVDVLRLLPTDTAYFIAAFGALCAPVPTEKPVP